MAQRIEVPGHGLVDFPDGMSDADIVAAIKKNPSQKGIAGAAADVAANAKAGPLGKFDWSRVPGAVLQEGKNIVKGIVGLPERALKAAAASPPGQPNEDLIKAGADTALLTAGAGIFGASDASLLGARMPRGTFNEGTPIEPSATIRAFHGSPYDFETFDASKIGTGEGAQSYGHGLYFAERPEVAKTYTKTNTNVPGKMYEVSINAHPDEFLHWDKPLSEQSQKIRDVFAGVNPKTTGEEIAAYLGRQVPKDKPVAKGVSELLSNAGIKGIKYLDQGSRDAGKGTSNYVVFDGKHINVVSKNGTPVKAPSKDVTLGAGLIPRRGAPPVDVPGKPFIANLEDDLHRLRTNSEADAIQMRQKIDQLPEGLKPLDQKFYHHIENPNGVPLSPREAQIFNKVVAPLKQEELALYKRAKGYLDPHDLIEFDPTYMHRMVKGKTPEMDTLAGGASPLPYQSRGRSLSRTTSSLKTPVFHAIENPSGTRRIVAKTKDGIVVFDRGKPQLVRSLGKDLVPGTEIQAQGQTWAVKRARTAEIERDTNVRYHQSAIANTMDNVLRLKRVIRNGELMDKLKSSDEFLDYATRGVDKQPPRDWVAMNVPGLHGWYMDPKMAAPINDFVKGGARVIDTEVADKLAKINRLAVGSLFWQPITHGKNVGVMWSIGRGWDNLNLARAARTGAKAIRSVMSQDADYVDFLRRGSSLLHSNIGKDSVVETVMRKMGHEIERDPARWGPIGKAFGFKTLADFVKAYYAGVSKELFRFGDMLMMQRLFELEEKGMSRAEAIKEAEKYIPNYRIPSEVAGSRVLSKVMQDPNVESFGRYNYNKFKAYAEMVKSLIAKDATPKQRFDALGRFAAAGALLTFGTMILNPLAQKLTGNKESKFRMGGTLAIPENIIDYTDKQKSFIQLLESIAVPAPGTEELIQQSPWVRRDFFTGQPISQGPLRQQVAESAAHAAGKLVNPLSIAQDPKKAVFQSLGITDPSKKAAAARNFFNRKDAQSARKRARKDPKWMQLLYGGPQ
jgi:ADP-Ribosyltransferase in polyvalent proteins